MLLLLAAPVLPETFGKGPKITWYSDAACTHPLAMPGAMQGQTIFGLLAQPAVASTYGVFTGTLTQIDPTHIKYVAPSALLPVHEVAGLQPLPNDVVFFTRVDQLPLLSSHYFGDGSKYCEGFQNSGILHCAGSPTEGTGNWSLVEPIGSKAPGAIAGPHVGMDSLNIGASLTSQATVLTGHEPKTRFWKASDGNTQSYVPDWRFKFYEHRQSGNFRTPPQKCNVGNPVPGQGDNRATPPFEGCAIGGKLPFPPGNIGEDMHTFAVDPLSTLTYESFADVDRFGVLLGCHNEASRTCTVGSWRQLDWTQYMAKPAMGLAGTPENQLELTGDELKKAAMYGLPIAHEFVFTLGGGFMGGSGHVFMWPALGPCYNCFPYTDITHTVPAMGARYRMSAKRTSMNLPILSSFTVKDPGSGYPPGSVLPIAVSGCASIDGKAPPSGLAFIGPTGSIAKNGIFYAFVTNTGMKCSDQVSASMAPPPNGGTPPVITVNLFKGPWGNANVAQALYDQRTRYGMQLDDIGGSARPEYRVDGDFFSSPYASTVRQFDANNSQLFGNWFLYEQVDESGLIASADGFPPEMTRYWLADSGSQYGSKAVTNQAMVKLTAKGGKSISYSPIPLLGVGVVSVIGDRYNKLHIAAGMTPFQIPAQTIGDPTNAGVTFSWAQSGGAVQDPCPGADTLTASGLYTTCPQFDGTAVKTGVIKITSKANPNAFALVDVIVIPTDSNGNIRLDVGGRGGCDANGSAAACPPGQGHTWVADCCLLQPGATSKPTDYPAWDARGRFGASAAPHSVVSEHFIYESHTYGQPDDLTLTLVVPNGTYMIRAMTGQPYNGVRNPQTATPPRGWHSFNVYQIGDKVQMWNACLPCETNNQFGQPVDFMIPAKVTDNVLRFAQRGLNHNRYTGYGPWNNIQKANGTGLSGIAILKDNTPPGWQMGSYVPLDFVQGDQFHIGLSDGVHTKQNAIGALYPGLLQLYVRDVFTGKDDPVWKLVSGPGSVTSEGLYVAPATAPPANTCAVVQAQSKSQPSLTVQQKICIDPSFQTPAMQ